MSGTFRPEVNSRPQVSSRFRPQVSSRFRPEVSSGLWPEVSSGLWPEVSSGLWPQINSVSAVKEPFQERRGATPGRQAVLWASARRAHCCVALPRYMSSNVAPAQAFWSIGRSDIVRTGQQAWGKCHPSAGS
jgi:hypothetical protein